MTGKQIKNVATQVQHDTLQRWGVSYDRFAELIEQMDSVFPSLRKHFDPQRDKDRYTLKQSIAHLTSITNVSKDEAFVLIQLYVVMRNKLDTLLN